MAVPQKRRPDAFIGVLSATIESLAFLAVTVLDAAATLAIGTSPSISFVAWRGADVIVGRVSPFL